MHCGPIRWSGGGQSPWAALQAWEDWGFHLAIAPGRQVALWHRAAFAVLALLRQSPDGAAQSDWAFRPDPADGRFRYWGWARAPFHRLAQFQLAAEPQWRAAAGEVEGIPATEARRVGFLTPSAAAEVGAPLIEECFVNLECRLADTRLVNTYNLFIMEVVQAWMDPARRDAKTIHHHGYGSFVVDGRTISLPSRRP